MSLLSADLWGLTPTAFWRWGRLLLGTALGLGLLLVMYLTWAMPDVAPFLPLLLLAGVGMWYLFRHPTLNLCVLLAAIVLVANRQAGIQVIEAIYGVYFLSFLGYWFVSRLFVYREREVVFRTPEAKALVLFLTLVNLSILLTVLFGGDLRQAFSEWISLTTLAFYFPVREFCARHRYGVKIVLLIICWIGLFVAVRNLINYQELILSATQVWEITRGRVTSNDTLLAVPSFFTLVLLIFSNSWKQRWLLLLPAFLLYFSGLILTQSRGYWVAFLLGATVMFVLVDRRYKSRMLLLGTLGVAGVLGLGALFLGDYLSLVLSGLGERFSSLGTAASQDISLVNRFLESAAVLDHIEQNPILGHGMGVNYRFFDITFELSTEKSFIHNGYLSLWFKFGICGLGLMLFFWWATVWRGLQVFRMRAADRLSRLCGLAVCISLIAIALVANTSNPFDAIDSNFIIAVMTGLAGGCYLKVRSTSSSTPSL